MKFAKIYPPARLTANARVSNPERVGGGSVDPRPFNRTNSAFLARRGPSGTSIERLETALAVMARFDTDPRFVPFDALHAMGCHPAIYLAERTISGICRRPNLYSVEHDDPKVVAETEEWLWPLLPSLLGSAARAFAYGSMAIVLNWNESPGLSFRAGGRNRNRPDHVHFTSSHELHPAGVEIEAAGDFLQAVIYDSERYDVSRSHVFRWDPEFGSWLGQSARRRAWRDFAEEKVIRKLEARYLERSVDSPYVAHAPSGSTEVEGVSYDNIDMMGRLLSALRGSGVAVLPADRDETGRQFGVETLDVPDRHSVWHSAITRRHASMMQAYLVSPSLGGVDELGAAQGKTLEDMLDEHIEDIATWCAWNLTEIVEKVHAKNHDPDRVQPPSIMSTDVGKAQARKILQSVLGLVNANAQGHVARFVDVAKALDKLGVPLMDPALAAEATSVAQVGRPRDPMGDREERREVADTREGEEDTGAPRDDRGEPEDVN